ncbi:hypothetical protein YPPY71_2267 [Yersinia pestis PY-71]|nr:hypothetical protein YPPY52_2501 [Yersinia pestis PY-52]EIS76986.1 hypothetical protein YPPY71_2267 [Yersinia pestis PY-71]EIT40509.1 hypothetical protein YPPY99_2577 [Yersinia pestis PY-99]
MVGIVQLAIVTEYLTVNPLKHFSGGNQFNVRSEFINER